MSKDLKISAATESDATEIIELAVEEIELLTKAFTLITDVLAGTAPVDGAMSEPEDKVLLH